MNLVMEQQVIIPCSTREDWVELARTREMVGTPFRKHILNLGTLIHPKTGEKLTLDNAWYDKLQANFTNGACDIVQVPIADAANQHTEDPLRNAGEVVKLEREGDKVFAVIDARSPQAVEGLRNKTLLGASAFINMDYTDTRTGQHVGPTLLHTCITNRPYVLGLDDYAEVIAATADGESEVVILSEEHVMPQQTKDELIAALMEHGVDVPALEAAAATKPDLTELTNVLKDALKGTPAAQGLQLSGGAEIQFSDIVGAITELSGQAQAYGQRVVSLERDKAEREVDSYISQGRVLPKQKSTFVDLALTNRDMMETLLPDEAVVRLNNQAGSPGMPQGEQKQAYDVDAEILRLTAEHDKMARSQASGKGARLPQNRR
jgi:hypothetical protein